MLSLVEISPVVLDFKVLNNSEIVLLSPLVEMGVVLYLMKLKSPSPKDSSFYPLESPLTSCRVIYGPMDLMGL